MGADEEDKQYIELCRTKTGTELLHNWALKLLLSQLDYVWFKWIVDEAYKKDKNLAETKSARNLTLCCDESTEKE